MESLILKHSAEPKVNLVRTWSWNPEEALRAALLTVGTARPFCTLCG